MGTKRVSAEETQPQPEPAVAVGRQARLTPAESRAQERRVKGAEVRRKYDFSVIRKLRHEKGLTIEKFAKACGLSYAPVSRIETNLIKPNLDTLDKIAEGLGITTHSLVALAEKRDVEQQSAQETRSGGMTLGVARYEGVEILTGVVRKGQTSGDFEYRNQNVVSLTVLSGKLQVAVNDKSRDVAAGETLHFEASFPHRFVAAEDAAFVAVLHPRR
ncbi:MAG TPA: helix-turn-helix domain-containing protein [Planctomycetota bacterium]|nr:helix-turn-helix domain-containing protein [Planctomycetota bacterium]